MPDNTLDVAVVGGGLAGLATAYFLQQQARAAGRPVRLGVLEQEARPGGKVITDRVDGFVIDGGPDSFGPEPPDALALSRDLGLDDQLIGSAGAQNRIYVLAGGKLHAPPAGLVGIVPTDRGALARSGLLGAMGKLRMAREVSLASQPATEDESIAAFVYRRFGQEAVDKLARPLLASPFLGEPEWLSMRLLFPDYLDLEREHGSLIHGMQARRQPAPSGPDVAPGADHPAFLSFRGGMHTLIEGLVAHLDPDSLQLGRTITQISRAAYADAPYTLRTKEGRGYSARRVVLAVPAPVAANLLPDRAAALAAALRQIRYLSSATVALGYRKDEVGHPLDGFGFAAAAREQTPLLTCTWTSTKFPDHAPAGHVLVRAVVAGSAGAPALDLLDLELTGLVRAELGRILGLNATPVVERVYRRRLANPQYDTGHLARVARLEALAADHLPGVYLAGSAYRGIDGAATVREARQATEQILAARQTDPPEMPA
jgi:oxygen-dependent protoporphyrinogen oxidase